MIPDWPDAIRAATEPLPGSRPYVSHRPIRVPGRLADRPLLDFLEARCPFFDRERWSRAIAAGRLLVDGRAAAAHERVHSGSIIVHVIPDTIEPDVATDIRVIHEDDDILIVDKPAPLPIHSGGRFHRNTLLAILSAARPDLSLRGVHRLDVDTTGCVLVGKGRASTDFLRRQFEAGAVDKEYLARVRPAPARESFSVEGAISRVPERGGRRRVCPEGRPARTDCKVLRAFADGSALLEVRPLTGRTNQIRLHLATAGHAIVGDRMYAPGAAAGAAAGDRRAPLCLHALAIAFIHPAGGARRRIAAAMPPWADAEAFDARAAPP